MMRLFSCCLLPLLVACDGGKSDCDITEGPWTMDGSCIGMEMTGTLTLSADGCSFTFSDWSMEMTNLPDGGTVSGETVTLTGETWTECTGSTDGSSMTVGCTDADGGTCDIEATAG